MKSKNQIYEPREDSYLLLDIIRKQRNIQNCIDMGTGSGILALEMAKNSKNVTAVDINKTALKELNEIIKKGKIKKINTIHSDLFSKIDSKENFDLIIFNPPYIPTEKIQFIDLDGGKNGTEIIERFLKNASNYLKDNGKILLLTSSLNKNIKCLFKKSGFIGKKLAEKKIFFEKLFIWELTVNV